MKSHEDARSEVQKMLLSYLVVRVKKFVVCFKEATPSPQRRDKRCMKQTEGKNCPRLIRERTTTVRVNCFGLFIDQK